MFESSRQYQFGTSLGWNESENPKRGVAG